MSYLPLCLVCLAIMTAFIIAEHAERYVAGVILKGCASLVFVFIGLLAMLSLRDTASAETLAYARLVVLGLAVGAVADVVLNLRYVYEKVAQPIFVLGTLVFLAGHVVYTIATFPRVGFPWPFLVAGGALTVILMRWIFQRIEAKAALKVVGVFYIGIIVILNCLALGALITAQSVQAAVFLAGTLLFLVSDVILILNTFGGNPRFAMRVCNLSLYYVGQLLIATSIQFLA